MSHPQHHPTTGRPPTPAQLQYLRRLAQRTGTSFAHPKTVTAASRQIARLKALAATAGPDSLFDDARRERLAISRDLHERPQDATAVRPDEITGYGSTATWKDHA